MKTRQLLFFIALCTLTPLSLIAVNTPANPILVLATTSEFGTYTGEILKTEGFNSFQIESPTDPAITIDYLNHFDVVILTETPLTSGFATLITSYVSGGGNLIAFRPDKQLASTFGLSDAAAVLSEGYLHIDTSTVIGNGTTSETFKYHGIADLYYLSGATSIATLYTDSVNSANKPAMVLHQLGNGRAVAFTYNLPKSVVESRQGNMALAGSDADGPLTGGPDPTGAIRPEDMFYVSPHQSWNDNTRNDINHADEQMTLLSHALSFLSNTKKPLPRLWYFPDKSQKAAIIWTDDYEGYPTEGHDATTQSNLDSHLTDLEGKGARMTVYLLKEANEHALWDKPVRHSYDWTRWDLGTRFSSSAAGQITDIRVWGVAGETGNHIARIWSSNGTKLGEYTFTFVGNDQWYTYHLTTPITITPNVVYTVSVTVGEDVDKNYAYAAGELSTEHSNGGSLTLPVNAGVYWYYDPNNPPSNPNGLHFLRDIIFRANGSSQNESLFGDRVISQGDGTSYELGTVFQSTVPGQITEIRVYGVSGETGPHTARIWRADGSKIAGDYTFTFEGSDSWYTYRLPSAITIEPNVLYTVSVSTGSDSTKKHAVMSNDLAYVRAPAQSCFISSPANAGRYTTILNTMPTSASANNFLRDVKFEAVEPTKAFVDQAILRGHEFACHVNDTPELTAPSWSGMSTAFETQLNYFSGSYGFPPTSVRNHWTLWCGKNATGSPEFSAQAKIEANNGIGADFNYNEWDGNGHPNSYLGPAGNFTGSGLPMKFADSQGNIIDTYQFLTQISDYVWDEVYSQGQFTTQFYDAFKTVLDRSIDNEQYTFLSVLTHTSRWKTNWIRPNGLSMLDYALARQVPVWTAGHAYRFISDKDQTTLGNVRWQNRQLSFTVTAPQDVESLTIMVPVTFSPFTLSRITKNGTDLGFSMMCVKGSDYALATISGGISDILAVYSESIFADKEQAPYGIDNHPWELGTVFHSTSPGSIVGIKVFGVTGESGDHVARVWNNANPSAPIAGPFTINFTGNNAWFTYLLPTAIRIVPNTDYTVSVSTGTDAQARFAFILWDLLQGASNGDHLYRPASAGVYGLPLGAIPTSTYCSANYLRDIVFVPDIFGYAGEGARTDLISDSNGNCINLAQYSVTAPAAVTATELCCKLKATTGRFRFAIYHDYSGSVGNLMAETEEVINPPSDGWYSARLSSSQVLLPGVLYWLAVWSDAGSNTASVFCENSGGNLKWTAPSVYGHYPSTITTVAGAGFQYCIYAR